MSWSYYVDDIALSFILHKCGTDHFEALMFTINDTYN